MKNTQKESTSRLVVFFTMLSLSLVIAACGYFKVFKGSGGKKITWTAEGGYQSENNNLLSCLDALDESDLTFASGDTATTVRGNITLPANISDCSLTWSVNSEAAAWVSVSGTTATITRVAGTANGTATLTATASKGEASGSKGIQITILRQVTDAEAVATCVANFPSTPFVFSSGDSLSDITTAFTGSTSQSDCSVSWSKSSDLTWLTISGGSFSVSRSSGSDQTGTLTATISRNVFLGASDSTKTFTIVIKRALLNSEVDDCASAISVSDITFASGDSSSAVTKNFSFPATKTRSSYRCSLSWAEVSDAKNALVISGDTSAAITRPTFTTGDATVTVKAIASSGSAYTKDSSNISFTVTKLPATSDESVLESCKAELTSSDIHSSTTIASGVTSITLPASLTVTSGTCTVSWVSSKTTHITVNSGSETGTVTHGHTPGTTASPTAVTLTATITKGTATDTKQFPFDVDARGTVSDQSKSIQITFTLGNPVIRFEGTDRTVSSGTAVTYVVCVSSSSASVATIASMKQIAGASPVSCSTDPNNPIAVTTSTPKCCTASSVSDFRKCFSAPTGNTWNANFYARVNGDPDAEEHQVLYAQTQVSN